MSKEELMSKFHIGPKTAEKTLQHTRQDGTRHAKFPLSRQYPTGHDHNRYNRLDGEWYADVFFNSTTSTEGHTCALVIYNGEFCWTKPLMSKSEVGKVARLFSNRVGMMDILYVDGAPEFIGKKCEFRQWFQRHGVVIKHTSSGQPKHNRAEHGVKWMKQRVKRTMLEQGVHPHLWSYCLVYKTDIYNRI